MNNAKSEIRNTLKKLFVNIKEFISTDPNIFHGDYSYPIKNEVILGLMQGENNIQKVERYLMENDRNFLEEYAKFKELLGNGNFNPYKPYKLLNYYVQNESFKSLDLIFEFKKYPSLKKTILYLGEKGSGKTATQNCWLHCKNSELESNNIFWVRCDGYKLYELWLEYMHFLNSASKESDEQRIISLSDYIDIQLLYVFAKYCYSNDRPFLQKIMNGLKEISYDKPISRYTLNSTQNTSLYDSITSFNNIISRRETASTKPGYSYAYDEVMKTSIRSAHLEKRIWLTASRSLQKYLFDNNYWILKIVDGMDNLHINKDEFIPYYNRMINETRQFIISYPHKNELRFATLREKTYIDIKQKDPFIKDFTRHIEEYPIQHISVKFSKIIQCRYDYAQNHFIKNDLFNNIAKIVSEFVSPDINIFHHNNVRLFLHNNLTLISQVYYRMKQLGSGHINIDHIKTLEQRNRFLNGRLFLCTKDDWEEINEESGISWFNPFYFNLEEYSCYSPHNWIGLCGIRILQLLIKSQKLNEENLISALCIGFEYPQNLIKKYIANYKAFGMIEIKLDNNMPYLFINNKGRHFIEGIFTNIDVLYYFGLDTPLPTKLIISGLINGHNNKFYSRTFYPFAAFSTTLTFILFLVYINEIEREKFNKNYDALKMVLKSINNFSDFVPSLPFMDKKNYNKLTRSILAQVNGADSDNVVKIRDYILKVTDLYIKI